jgi:hypothetical protein
MTEDSGAFKTNPANSGPISAWVIACGPCGHRAAPPGKRIFGIADGILGVDFLKGLGFLTSARRPLRYSRISLIRARR